MTTRSCRPGVVERRALDDGSRCGLVWFGLVVIESIKLMNVVDVNTSVSDNQVFVEEFEPSTSEEEKLTRRESKC